MKNGQVLVLGGSGFIGRHVVQTLLNQFIPVRVISRHPNRVRLLFPTGNLKSGQSLECVRGDLNDPDSLREAMKNCDSLINVAGCYQFGPSHRHALYETNVTGIHCLLKAWQGRKGRFIHVSTAGVWEQDTAHSLRRPDIPSRAFYKLTKCAGEKLVLEAARQGMNATVVSPTCPVGAGDDAPTPTGRMILDFMRGGFPFSSHTGINLIHVTDLAEGILQAWKCSAGSGPYVLGDKNLWLDELFSRLAPYVSRQPPQWHAPHWLIEAAGTFGEIFDQISPGFSHRTQLCRETAWLSRRTQFFDLSSTRRDLDWKPIRGVDRALEEAVHWYQLRQTNHENSVPLTTDDIGGSTSILSNPSA